MADYTMDVTDRVGEWCAVLETLAERETHEWRRKKLVEVASFLRSHRYSDARIEALEAWVRDSARHHHEAAAALPDSHGEPHRNLCNRARTLLSTTEADDGE